MECHDRAEYEWHKNINGKLYKCKPFLKCEKCRT